MRRRAQTSAEYLIILAVILIITIIVLQVSIKLPKSREAFENEAEHEYWKSADVGLLSWAANSSHITLKVQNNMPSTIEIEDIYLNDIRSFSKDFTLEPGKTKAVIANFTWNETNQGDLYEAEVRFGYEDIVTGYRFTFYGQSSISGSLTAKIR
jgi:hypothetical protein